MDSSVKCGPLPVAIDHLQSSLSDGAESAVGGGNVANQYQAGTQYAKRGAEAWSRAREEGDSGPWSGDAPI